MNPILIGADLVAIALLVFVLFVPRHGRRDLIVAYLGVNVGVLAVSAALSSVGAGVGVGEGGDDGAARSAPRASGCWR